MYRNFLANAREPKKEINQTNVKYIFLLDFPLIRKHFQGVEQSTANIMYFSLAEKLYPESGYYAETGGYLANLRNSTNIKKVREYHKKFYR